MYQTQNEYGKAEEYQIKALAITKQISDKKGEAACYGNLGTMYYSLGEYRKTHEYHRKAIVITKGMATLKE